MEQPAADHSWIHDGVRIGDSSVHGRGLFTTAPIERGTRLIRIRGAVVGDSAIREYLSPFSTIASETGEELLIHADDAVHFLNHSCDPTVLLSGDLELVARRDLEPGTEVTVDYATLMTGTDWKFVCSCGTTACRVLVSNEDWQREELQSRYEGHWHPVILKRRIRPNEW